MKKVTLPEDDGFRTEHVAGSPGFFNIRRDYHEPLPVGTVVAMVFRITGYDKDCDGSAMMRVEALDKDGRTTGWSESNLGVYPESMVVLEDAGELHRIAEG